MSYFYINKNSYDLGLYQNKVPLKQNYSVGFGNPKGLVQRTTTYNKQDAKVTKKEQTTYNSSLKKKDFANI